MSERLHSNLKTLSFSLSLSAFSFTSSRINLTELLGLHFISKFVDPQIEVRLNNDYDHQSIISSQSSSVTDKSGRNKKQQRRAMRNNNNNKSRDVASDFEGLDNNRDHQRRFLNTFSALDISNINNSNSKDAIANASMSPSYGNWFKTNALVRVRAVQSPEDFYVQSVHTAQRIREHLEAFVSTDACQPPGIIVVGQQYITYHNQGHTDRWHRSLVSHKSEVQDTYNVFLPDLGVTYQVHCNK